MNTNVNNKNTKFQRAVYGVLLIIGISHAFIFDDYVMGASTIALALIFDPFNSSQKWKQKPHWQKSIVLGHLIIAVLLIVIALLQIVRS